MNREELKKLRQATDDAIGEVESQRLVHGEAINWADLSCMQAAWVETDDGEAYAEVKIEEAAPECPKFAAEIERILEKANYPGVRVVTEW